MASVKQRYLLVIKFIAVSRGTLNVFYSEYFIFPFSIQNLDTEVHIVWFCLLFYMDATDGLRY